MAEKREKTDEELLAEAELKIRQDTAKAKAKKQAEQKQAMVALVRLLEKKEIDDEEKKAQELVAEAFDGAAIRQRWRLNTDTLAAAGKIMAPVGVVLALFAAAFAGSRIARDE